MSLSKEAIEERRKGVGGSDIAAIMGYSPWATAYDIYLSKIGEEADKPTTLAMEVGNFMEDFVAQKYEEILKQKSTGITVKIPLFIHPQYEYIRGNFDRLIMIHNEKDALLECKTANAFSAREWGESCSEKYPYHYRLQIAYYRAIMNCDYVDLAVLIGNNDFRIYRYKKDSKLEEDILNAVHFFWNNHVIPRVPPLKVVSKKIVDVTPDSRVVADNETSNLIYLMRENRADVKELEEHYKRARKHIETYIGEKEALIDEYGNILVSYTLSTREAFDMDKFKNEQPDMYIQYSDFPKPVRTFRLTMKDKSNGTEQL